MEFVDAKQCETRTYSTVEWIARRLYEAYRDHTGGVSLASGQPIPTWDDMREDVKDAWRASGRFVVENRRLL